MGGAAIELIMKALVWGLGRYMKVQARDAQGKKDYIEFSDIMYRKGLTSVQLRLRSNDQIERINAMWDEEIENEKKPKA